MSEKMNCWEFMKCGRGPKGRRVKELGQCEAATCITADGLNGGVNGGRMCWAVAGIYSIETAKGPSSRICFNCYECDFHRKVLSEEKIIGAEMLDLHGGIKRKVALKG